MNNATLQNTSIAKSFPCLEELLDALREYNASWPHNASLIDAEDFRRKMLIGADIWNRRVAPILDRFPNRNRRAEIRRAAMAGAGIFQSR